MNKDIKVAKQTVNTEIQALKKLLASFNRSSQFSKAVNLISKLEESVWLLEWVKAIYADLKLPQLYQVWVHQV